MNKVWIALGSNMGEGRKNLDLAIKMMNERGVSVKKVSTYIETEPYGYTEQDNFVNAVCIAETKLSPRELLETLLKIELEMGRVRIIKWGPRIIDLDILFYEDLIIDEEDLKVPHIEIQKRSFVLEPMNEISPDKIHPVFKKSVNQLLLDLNACDM
ncbi:2-amino-4-hydroxy-6-hydroxymethyldihydropteridine diphosphokinase [Parvimonas micra]|uniref:2-amino-4-hydroxy-6-hydroxymethyldihydropteridine diphosphokinase n=1 Tax=Parvimonas micra TaxID=33033 RepID=A0A9X3H9K1_9FIRM|nr:2-amino-4-hydroxy-6-hydroxymethyldihydropteridine diphosphokinase [Parvimonas micra]MCZ7407196.1 2-amino-4-hydroxy-6-hydroxymethyldihydropteridine diphosphokinase [Parvimonas micra]MCZ7410949.1 2-amino-4-hydroxy-6-hydroxymethyldihydropteridine diphosphokinase [Parvimonas micra]MCZ7411442.1 2-amino-4-hydroxy-6-hydroxymethyldihydropteridine diphosphokinase [Parvimonas micra]WBB37353.1 2-amino-4-hydroxy-6-hydroxymethyldihydropteridine diphosphokinase [Parvimonas micra]